MVVKSGVSDLKSPVSYGTCGNDPPPPGTSSHHSERGEKKRILGREFSKEAPILPRFHLVSQFGDLQHGKTCLRIDAVPRWLRRPHEAWAACARGLPSLPRGDAWPDGPHLRTPHLRDHALLGRRSSRLGGGGPRLRGGVAEPAEVGHVAFPQVRWPQRHAGRG